MKLRPNLARPSPGPGLAFVLAALLALVAVVGTSANAPPTAYDPGFSPLSLYRRLDRQVQRAYARGVRLVSHMRLIYEVRTLLQAQDSASVEAAPAASRAKRERAEPLSGCSKIAWGNFLPLGR
jgi:hypothetical protein